MPTNALLHEKSPYLLQHAHNPVNWIPWSEEAMTSAQKEGKLMILSIGYSACHWCHVMERETFEDASAAALMNEYFVCVKIDREEHPDVDQVYMSAVQLMTGQGGWPLNVVCLADGRPIWGGTYFPRDQWVRSLQSIVNLWQDDLQKVETYAAQLTEGVRQAELVQTKETAAFSILQADALFESWKERLDNVEGGSRGAPKFPLPNNYAYLLHYASARNNTEALTHVSLTLQKMAQGGIYDQLGGGFARYSTDAQWKVPHFEKMLYDNAQLIALYADAWRVIKDPLFQQTVQQTVGWALEELSGQEGQFYSALDADTEGEEGKYYVWTIAELKALIPTRDWDLFSAYYALDKGHWEGEKIVLLRNPHTPADPDKEALWREKLLPARNARTRPATDDKALCSWNALMITALVKANHLAPRKNAYMERAEQCAGWLLHYQKDEKGKLKHAYKNKEAYVEGLLEDYAFSIEAFIHLYSSTGKTGYLEQAKQWVALVDESFLDTNTMLYFSRSMHSPSLIAKSTELHDNVLPAPNSTMAKNLFLLSRIEGNNPYHARALKMLSQLILDRFLTYGESYSNWAQLHLWCCMPFKEVAVLGEHAAEVSAELQKHYLPQSFVAFTREASAQALFQHRFSAHETLLYVCEDQQCQLPVKTIEDALNLIKL
jgi:uncharacterized protein YyaL (SSP411 family)